MRVGPDPAIWAGPKLARPKGKLIILPLHAEMNSTCSGLDEKGGNAGRRKLSGLGVSDVLRMSGRWLRRIRLRWRWPESAVRRRRKRCRGERKAGRRREREPRWQLGGRLVVVLASCGGPGVRGRNGGSVGCLWRRKKEKDAEEDNLQRGEGRSRGGCAYRRWGFGFVGRLRCRLLVEEECLCGVFKGWRSSGREREKREGWLEEKQGRSWFFGLFNLDPILSSLGP